ncbi:LysR family transcriptional regulator [Salinifilum aidingensis]
MELYDLRIFRTAARTGGITAAARELHTVQSNISSRIAALEKELGADLFHRHARGVVLTGSGQQLLGYAERISELAEEARRTLADQDDPSGPLRIGALETTAGLRLPGVISAFSADCPRVELSLITGATDGLIADVLAHRLDGAFVSGPVQHADLEAAEVFTEQLVLVTAPAVPSIDAALRGAAPKLLVFRRGCSYRRRLEDLAPRHDAPAPQVLEFGTLEGILGCVRAGMGCTLLPEAVVDEHVRRGRVRTHALPPEHARTDTAFVRRRDTTAGPALRRFAELAQQHAAPAGGERAQAFPA